MKITDLRLFHNHMSIELVLEVFGRYDRRAIEDVREAVFKAFAKSDCDGMIFTYMWAFNYQEDWDYIEHVKQIFAPYGTQFYYVELTAPQQVRLERNATENRLQHKPSKRDIEVSNARLVRDDQRYRCESLPGEIPFENYMKIDNTNLAPEMAAQMIRERFSL